MKPYDPEIEIESQSTENSQDFNTMADEEKKVKRVEKCGHRVH